MRGRCVGFVVGVSRAFGWDFGGGCRCGVGVDEAGFAGAFAGDGLHGGGHVDVEFVAGAAAFGGWGFDGVGGAWGGCDFGVFARCLENARGRVVEGSVVFLVVFVWVFEFAGIGFAVLAVVWGSFRAADLVFEGHILVLPFNHGLLSFQCGVVEGIVREGFVVCEG